MTRFLTFGPICALFLLSFLFVLPASAEEKGALAPETLQNVDLSKASEGAKESIKNAEEKIKALTDGDPDITVMKDPFTGEYVKGTLQNLSKLYWRLKVFDDGDNRAIDNFMFINECEIYQDHINDDFEWREIREAAKKMLKKDSKNFSQKFQFILPVHLGKYDIERKGFPLVDNTDFINSRRMEVIGNSLQYEICGKQGEIKDYPRNIMMIFKKSFTYDFAEVDEHVAQAYLLKKQREIKNLPIEIRQRRYERTAYVRLRVSFNQYQGNVKGRNLTILSILHGELEGVDLFEDPYGKQLMSSKTIKTERE